MSFSFTAIPGSLPILFRTALLVLPLSYASVLLWQERAWRNTLPKVENLPASPAPARDERQAFNPRAIAAVLGLAGQDAPARSTEALVLRASFVSSAGDSRALLAGAEGQRTYQVGDTLPGGSVLRRVEVAQAVLWRDGREEVLPLETTGKPTLRLLERDVHNAVVEPSSHHLQPTTHRDQSD